MRHIKHKYEHFKDWLRWQSHKHDEQIAEAFALIMMFIIASTITWMVT